MPVEDWEIMYRAPYGIDILEALDAALEYLNRTQQDTMILIFNENQRRVDRAKDRLQHLRDWDAQDILKKTR